MTERELLEQPRPGDKAEPAILRGGGFCVLDQALAGSTSGISPGAPGLRRRSSISQKGTFT